MSLENYSPVEKVVEGKESSFLEKLSLEQLKGKRVAKVLAEYDSPDENEKNFALASAEEVKKQVTWIDDILSKKKEGAFSSSDIYVLRNCYTTIRDLFQVKSTDSAEEALIKKKVAQTLLEKGAFLPSFEQVIFALASHEGKKAQGPLKIENLAEGDVLTIALGEKGSALGGKILLEDLLPVEVSAIQFAGKEYVRKDGKFVSVDAADETRPVYTKDGDQITIVKIKKDLSTTEKKQYQDARSAQMKESRVQEVQENIKETIKTGKNPESLTLNEKDIGFFFEAISNIFKSLFGNFDGILASLKAAFSGGSLDMGKSGMGARFKEALGGDKIAFSSICSPGIEYSETGTTLCSWTVVRNAKETFAKELPQGNAYDVRDQYAAGNIGSAEKYIAGAQAFSKYEGSADLFDVFTTSSSPYGHRVLGFRQGQQIYILDPYTTGTNKPLTLDDYRAKSGREIVGVAFHKSDKTVVA